MKKRERSTGHPAIAFAWLFMLMAACATPPQGPGSGRVQEDHKPPGEALFQSSDYIVYILKGDETPGSLAQRFLGDPAKAWVIEDANEGTPFVKDQAIAIPLRDENRGGLSPDGYQVVPVLCYHDFAKTCKSSLCVPEQIFEEQIKYLKDNHYRVITLGELLGFIEYRHSIPKRSVVITIDDGYRSTYDIVYPILKKYGFRATLFIYTAFVGASRGAVTWDQLREMRNYGFEIGSHTISHIDLTKKLNDETDTSFSARIMKELKGSKDLLDSRLEQDTALIAFPYGKFNQTVLDLTSKAGYRVALSVKRGGNPLFADPMQLRRTQILKADMDAFVGSVKTFQEAPLAEKP
ncbi:MAG: polysaccharide deacetylase family protein [Desulfobacteraceae bacterium]|jgi:peptidoglycan/xylan/chitin deacetylase (PgdA/CDA1 family)|nr:MAG: polysaccharide deacetylase family protein [Desulfobacteraceae bacterium]